MRVEGDVAWCFGVCKLSGSSAGVNKCTFIGWWWLGAKVRVRWETDGVCGGRCLMGVTSMHIIKSRRAYV
jgi:hypothetical protein